MKKDYTGQTYNYWTFIRADERTKGNGRTMWQCKCECGTIACIVPYAVISGNSKSCGCVSTAAKYINRTGQKYNMLTFIKPTDLRTPTGSVIWECLCECGNSTTPDPIHVVMGRTKSCGCLHREVNIKNRKFSPLISTARTVWGRYKNTDKRRFGTIDNFVDFDTFFAISQHNCLYCGCPPSSTFNHATATTKKKRLHVSELQWNEGNFTYNGMDRVDSSKGHVYGNVVPCCAICNYMKSNNTVDEFVSHINRMFHHLQKHPII